VIDVYDGDTVTVDLDLGFHVWKRGEKIRLAHIDAPELRGESQAEGKAAGDFLRDLVLNKNVIIPKAQAAATSRRNTVGISE
jgi:endonuclease YncB( thermonuclease family)